MVSRQSVQVCCHFSCVFVCLSMPVPCLLGHLMAVLSPSPLSASANLAPITADRTKLGVEKSEYQSESGAQCIGDRSPQEADRCSNAAIPTMDTFAPLIVHSIEVML